MDKDTKMFIKCRRELLKEKIISNNLISIGFYNSFFKKSNNNEFRNTLKNKKKFNLIRPNSINNRTYSSKDSTKNKFYSVFLKEITALNKFQISKKKEKMNEYSFYSNENDMYKYLYDKDIKKEKKNNLVSDIKSITQTYRDRSRVITETNFTTSPKAFSKYILSGSDDINTNKEASYHKNQNSSKKTKRVVTPILRKFPASEFKEKLDNILNDFSKKHDKIKNINSTNFKTKNFLISKKNKVLSNNDKFLIGSHKTKMHQENLIMGENSKKNDKLNHRNNNNLSSFFNSSKNDKESKKILYRNDNSILYEDKNNQKMNENINLEKKENILVKTNVSKINKRELSWNLKNLMNEKFPIFYNSNKTNLKSQFKTDDFLFENPKENENLNMIYLKKDINYLSYIESYNFKNNCFLNKYKNRYLPNK